jgi:hypothetical protein
MGSTGAGVTVGAAGEGGGIGIFTGGGFWGHCGVESRKSAPNTIANPINTKIPGHQRPPIKRKASRNNQKNPRKGLHG